MYAFGIGEVLFSRNEGYEPGDLVYINSGLQKYALINVPRQVHIFPCLYEGFAAYHYLNLLGTNGPTAYYGILKIGKPKSL